MAAETSGTRKIARGRAIGGAATTVKTAVDAAELLTLRAAEMCDAAVANPGDGRIRGEASVVTGQAREAVPNRYARETRPINAVNQHRADLGFVVGGRVGPRASQQQPKLKQHSPNSQVCTSDFVR